MSAPRFPTAREAYAAIDGVREASRVRHHILTYLSAMPIGGGQGRLLIAALKAGERSPELNAQAADVLAALFDDREERALRDRLTALLVDRDGVAAVRDDLKLGGQSGEQLMRGIGDAAHQTVAELVRGDVVEHKGGDDATALQSVEADLKRAQVVTGHPLSLFSVDQAEAGLAADDVAHPDLSSVSHQGEDAESPGRETDPAAEPEVVR